MQNYINTITKQYPVSEQDIRNTYPNVSFPSPFQPPEEYKVVFSTPQPSFNSITHIAREIAPALTNKGNYEQQWDVISKFQEYTDEQGVVHTVEQQEQEALANVLMNVKEAKWNSIKSYRNKLTQEGGYKVGNNWYHSDTFSRSQQLGLVMMGNNIPQDLMWKTMNGSFVKMTPTLAQAIFQSAAAQDNAIFSYAENLNSQVQGLQQVEEVQSFDITQGWPETYQP